MMRWSVVVRGVVLWLLLVAPGALAGETGWREIKAPHVTLRTDLGSGAARDAALTVERYRAEIIAAAWPKATFPPNDVIEMTVFGNGIDFERYFGRNIVGVFFHDLPPHAVMYGTPDRWEQRATLALQETNSVLKHELTHHLAASIFKRQPKWFAEGVAQFLETVRPSDDGKSVLIGAVNLDALTKYKRVRSLKVADALKWEGTLDSKDEMSIHGYYGLSWMMVHWLFNEHPDQFTQLQVLLSKGIDSEKAWKVIQPGLGTTDVDGAIQAYALHGNYQEFQAPFVAPTATGFTEKPLNEADVHATLARVAFEGSRSTTDGKALRAEGQKEIATALQLDPKNLGAQLLQIRYAPPTERPQLLKKLIADHPEDGTAWLMASATLPPGDKAAREEAVRKAYELLPDNAQALNNYAWMLLQQGKAGEAAAPAVKAVTLAPFEASILDTLAAVQAALGRCSEARGTQARAVDALPEQASPQTQQAYRKKLTEYETTCVSAAIGATASNAPPGAPGPPASAPPTTPAGK
jgi:tetratricopeptide (TPR) repeat protein